VVQDAFLQALRRWPEVRGYDRPEAWVRRVALNRLVDHERRRGRSRRAVERMRAEPPPPDHPVTADLDLLAAVADLSPQQRQVVGLYYLADLPVREVAEDLDIAEGTVKSHLAAARRALAAHLEVVDD
jgi:RNA polymerase sigma-70 factor (ECF subfamily)